VKNGEKQAAKLKAETLSHEKLGKQQEKTEKTKFQVSDSFRSGAEYNTKLSLRSQAAWEHSQKVEATAQRQMNKRIATQKVVQKKELDIQQENQSHKLVSQQRKISKQSVASGQHYAQQKLSKSDNTMNELQAKSKELTQKISDGKSSIQKATHNAAELSEKQTRTVELITPQNTKNSLLEEQIKRNEKHIERTNKRADAFTAARARALMKGIPNHQGQGDAAKYVWKLVPADEQTEQPDWKIEASQPDGA